MKINVCLLAVFLGLTHAVLAQAPVTLQHNGTSTMFYTSSGLLDAYNASLPGDTIYLPGGFFAAINIDKGIAIIGAGHHPDSTMPTGATQINGSVGIGPDADSVHLEGLHITGNLNVVSANLKTDRLRIIRNLIDGQLTLNGNRTTPSLHVEISGNIIRSSVDMSNTLNAVITNNIFTNRVHYVNQGSISNNVFTQQPYMGHPVYLNYNIYDCDNSVIENNVFVNADQVLGFVYCDNSVIRKNLFAASSIDFGNSLASGNYTGVPSATILVNWTSTSFLYTDNYHLKTPQSYPGYDNTEVGIYGGLKPWKEGSIPLNPHIQVKTISSKTDAQGQIQVQVKVAAQ